MIIDELCAKIARVGNPSVIGLDTAPEYLPDYEKIKGDTKATTESITEFNARIIEKIKSIVPAVKIQIAYYEALGLFGMEAFSKTVKFAKQSDIIVIADAKRGDIGATAKQYAAAFSSGDFDSDFVTVNAYFGIDGVKPFLGNQDKGIFVLVKTSNPSGGEVQDLRLENGLAVYEQMAKIVRGWGADWIGKSSYSNVGAVVGATYPDQARELRVLMPNTFFLIPGYGAQGGGADGAVAGFDSNGRGGIVNSSRGIICAYRQDKYKGMNYADAAYAAAIDMRENLMGALARR